MTKNYTFNHTTKTIILSKSFDKKAKPILLSHVTFASPV